MYGNEGEGVRVPDGPYLRHTQMRMLIPAAEVGRFMLYGAGSV